MADIFISYAREDRETVAKLAAALEGAGFSLWWDRRILAGTEFSEEIERELMAAKAVIVAWSADGVKSRWVKDEALVAQDAGKIVPVTLDGTLPPMGFRQFHTIHFAGWKGEADATPFTTLKDSIAAKAGAHVTPVAAAPKPKPGSRASPKLLLAGGALVVLLALGTVAWFALRPGHAPDGSVTTNAPAPDAGIAAPSIPEASLAVLPFENLSTDKANAFFATGIQDEILTRLTKIGSLKVISRTSTAHLASRPDNLPELAKWLGVANVLEGSVQREGNAVRVNVQLIKAATDAHLWAEIYDRKLDDIFAVQSEIAIAIAEALSAKVTGAEQQALALKPTDNAQAYDAYLHALTLEDAGEYKSAERFLNEAVRLDPNFALAWVLLTKNHLDRLWAEGDRTEARRAAARTALDKAVRLQPELPEVQLAQGFYEYYLNRNYEGARRRFEQVRAKWPHNAAVNHALGLIARRQGRWDDAKTSLDEAVALDPSSRQERIAAAETRIALREFSAALSILDGALAAWPRDSYIMGLKALTYQGLGQLDLAEPLIAGLHPRSAESSAFFAITNQARLSRRYAGAIGVLEEALAIDRANGSVGYDAFGRLNLYLGDLRRLSGDAAGAKKNYGDARSKLLEALAKEPNEANIHEMLALIYCGLGERDAAMKHIERSLQILPVSKDALDGASAEASRAYIEARFGERDKAIPHIARVLKLPNLNYILSPATLRVDPDFDKLRGDARFEALLKEEARP